MMKSVWEGAEGIRADTGSQPALPRAPTQAPGGMGQEGAPRSKGPPLLNKPQAGLVAREASEVDRFWNPTP